MRETSSRRDFLMQAVAPSAVLGFPFLCSLTAAGPEGGPPLLSPLPDFLALARQRMKRETRPGVILVIPPDPGSRQRMALGLAGVIGAPPKARALEQKGPAVFKGWGHVPPAGPGDSAAQRLFCQAVFVCLPEEEVRKLVPDLKPDDRAVLLGLDARPDGRLRGDLSFYEKGFAARVAELLHGERGQHLAAAAGAQRRALGEPLARRCDADLLALGADRFAARQAAHDRLAGLAPRIPALLEQALHARPVLEVRRRVERLFEDLYARGPDDSSSPRLPFGVEWREEKVDPCLGCGLSSAAFPSRLFLRFATDPKGPACVPQPQIKLPK